MKNKKIILESLSFNSRELSNKNRINSSLNNISKQLKNISLTDVNILTFKYKNKKTNSTNKITSVNKNSHNSIYFNKSYKYKTVFLLKHKPYINHSYELDNDLKIVNSDSFFILNSAGKNIESKLNLKKKNLILKENLKFLLDKVKKYKNQEQNNSEIEEYKVQIEYYMNELDKYHKEITILKEKYLAVIKENDELKRYINFELNKLNNSILTSPVCNTEKNKSSLNTINKSKNLKSLKYLNFNIKEYLERNKKINLNKRQLNSITSKSIFKSKKKISNHLKTEDKQIKKISSINITRNKNSNNNFDINDFKKLKKINTNRERNNKDILENQKRNLKNDINQTFFKIIGNKTNFDKNRKRTIKKILSKCRIVKDSVKDNKIYINKSINLSKDSLISKYTSNNSLSRKKIYLNKYNNYIYFNNHTFNEN